MVHRLNILGRFQLTVGSTEVTVGASKHVALLSFLAATAPLPQPRDRLTELLWGERFEDQARQSLRQAVSQIRRNAGQHSIESRGGFYSISDQITTDYSEFMSLAGTESTEELARAVSLWRGELLEGLSVPGSAFEPWLSDERRVTRERFIDVLVQLVRNYLAGGNAREAVRTAERAVRMEPLRDDLRRLAIEAYASAGRRADALRQYQDFSRLLREELGAAPDPQTADLVARVSANEQRVHQDRPYLPLDHRDNFTDTAAAASGNAGPGFAEGNARFAASAGLPAEPTKFIGRRHLTSTVADQVKQSSLVTLTGPGGVGKTRLARRVAADVSPAFPDGVAWVALADVREARLVMPKIAAALGLGSSGDLSIDALVQHCFNKNMLVVLDNFEQVAGAGTDVARLLSGAPGLHFMITSRVRLKTPSEQLIVVPPLATDLEAGGAAKIAELESVALFVDRVRSQNPDFELRPENASSVLALVSALDGLPLAIELAAARCRLLAPQGVLARLGDRLSLLRVNRSDTPHRHRALRETIEWSYGLLSPPDQALLARLGIFAGAFTAEAAESVAGGKPVEDVLESLQTLIDHSLLGTRTHVSEVRLSLLESIRDFAMERLLQSGEHDAVALSHAEYFASMAELAEPLLTREDRRATVEQLARDEANLRRAVDFARRSGKQELGLRLVAPSWRFWLAEGYATEAREWLDQVLADDAISPRLRTKGYLALGGLTYWQGEYDSALSIFFKALDLSRETGDGEGEAEALLSLSTTSTWNDDPSRGAEFADEALNLFQRLGRDDKVGMTLMAQGFAKWRSGDLLQARPLWVRSRLIALEVGDAVEAAVKRLAIASIDAQIGGGPDPLEQAVRALEELQVLGDLSFVVMALEWVAALGAEGKPNHAARLAGAVEKLREKFGSGMSPQSCGLLDPREQCEVLLGSEEMEEEWRHGRRLSLDEAIALAKSMRGPEGTGGNVVLFPRRA